MVHSNLLNTATVVLFASFSVGACAHADIESSDGREESSQSGLTYAPGWQPQWGAPARPGAVVEGDSRWPVASVCGHLADFEFDGSIYEVVDIQTHCVVTDGRQTPDRSFVGLREVTSLEEVWLTSGGGQCGDVTRTMRFSAAVGDLVAISPASSSWREEFQAYELWSNRVLRVFPDSTAKIAGITFATPDGLDSARALASFPDSRTDCPATLVGEATGPLPRHPDAPTPERADPEE